MYKNSNVLLTAPCFPVSFHMWKHAGSTGSSGPWFLPTLHIVHEASDRQTYQFKGTDV